MAGVSRKPQPSLRSDTFVPTEMVYRLYDAKPSDKSLWIADDAIHAQAYKMHKSEYVEHIRQAVSTVAHP